MRRECAQVLTLCHLERTCLCMSFLPCLFGSPFRDVMTAFLVVFGSLFLFCVCSSIVQFWLVVAVML